MLLWGMKDRETQATLVTRCSKNSDLFLSSVPLYLCPVFGCLGTLHNVCWGWLHCIHYFSQHLRGDLTVLSKFSAQDREEESPLQSSGFKTRPVSPAALYCLGSFTQLCLMYHQPEMLQHPASHKQERERRWTSHQAAGQGKEQQPEHLPVMLILSYAEKKMPRVGQRAYALLSRAVPQAKHSWRKSQKPSNAVNVDTKHSEQC